MKKLRIVLLFLMMSLLLVACGDEDPDERDPKKNPTPTEASEVTPTAEATPTGEPTQEPTLTEAPTPEPTPTETPTPEPTPTEEPLPTETPVPTETPTPTPTEAPKLPAVAAKAGPSYVIGESDWYYYKMDSTDPKQGIHLDLVYITDPGYESLAEYLQGDLNYRNMDVFLSYKASASPVTGKSDDELLKHQLRGETEIGRSDSLVFSAVTRFSGYKTDMGYREYVYTYNYETATGKTLSLDQMVLNVDELYTAITEIADKDPALAGVFKDDSWKEIYRKRLVSGTAHWLAVDEGLEFYLDSFNYTSLTKDLVSLRVRVVDYPELFAPEWIGGYDGSIKRSAPDYDKLFTNTYKTVISEFAKGVKQLTWEEAAAILSKAGISYEGMNDKEAADWEDDANLLFTDPDNGQAYRVDFWPFAQGDAQRITTIWFRGDVNIYIDNAYGDLPAPRMTMVDPWIYDDFDEVIGVTFDSVEDLGAVAFGTLKQYR
ncbi:MAG: hypothetical protein J5649_07050 [Lachnospiraceae bacterium]|nr:hypothetical protein [Lachnospiraceae bacterium]